MNKYKTLEDLELESRFIETIEEDLLDLLIDIKSSETLQTQIQGVKHWETSLLEGKIPDASPWPPEEISYSIRQSLQKLNLASYCQGQSELVHDLLKDILISFQKQHQLFGEALQENIVKIHQNLQKKLSNLEKLKRKKNAEINLEELSLDALRQKAKEHALQAMPAYDQALIDQWGERARVWAEVWDVFGDLGLMMGRGWDLSFGVLRQAGWKDVLRLQELMKQLPKLREVIQILGRLQHSDEGESVSERVLVPVRRLEEERREVRTPLVPAEVRGVERSGEIARMLPAEASLLVHPTLRLLWHARRAEHALMTYRVEGVEWERVWVERETQEEIEEKKPRPQRGPIIVIVDTSGSMHGTPELVAKALSLEALKTAHAENRRCFLYAYSGPGQILEHELSLSPEGLGGLLSFLAYTFGGGNDEVGVIKRVVDRLAKEGWRRADVLMVSDGEWPTPKALLESVEQAKKEGNRFHGVQIGNKGQTGLHAVCDPVHVFREWSELARWS